MVIFLTANELEGTAITLVWENETVKNIIIKCHTIEHTNDNRSNHFPIEFALELNLKKLLPAALLYDYSKTTRNLLKLNWNITSLLLSTKTTFLQMILTTTPYPS